MGLTELFVHSNYSADLQKLVYDMISGDYLERLSAEQVLAHKCLYEGTGDVDRKVLFSRHFLARPVAY